MWKAGQISKLQLVLGGLGAGHLGSNGKMGLEKPFFLKILFIYF